MKYMKKLKTNIGSKWKLDPKTVKTRRHTRDYPVQFTPHFHELN